MRYRYLGDATIRLELRGRSERLRPGDEVEAPEAEGLDKHPLFERTDAPEESDPWV